MNGLLLRGKVTSGKLLMRGKFVAADASFTPLTPGTISLISATSSIISLLSTEATGGIGIKTHQWKRSISPLGPFSNIGTNSLALVDSGLASSTTYYYQLVFTDTVGAAATATFSATTSAAGISIDIQMPVYVILHGYTFNESINGPVYDITQFDIPSPIMGTLVDSVGNIVDLSNATKVEWHLSPMLGGAAVIAASAFIVSINGQVGYTWVAGNADVSGDYWGAFYIEFGGSLHVHFPTHPKILVRIRADVG